MSLRGAQRRGNLKAEGMASHSEARCPFETDFKHFEIKMVGFIAKPAIFVSLRGRRAAVAILKPKVWHPAAKHGSTKQQNPQISDRHGATPQRRFAGSAISRGRKPAFPVRSIFHTIKGRISPRSHTRLKDEFHRAALPCLVPGCRLVPSKIAASGIENALLAMTESVGFSEKRDSFQNEMFEKRCGATPRKKTAYNKNRPNFVSLRGAQRRGNLKAEGMSFLGEARCPCETDFKHFGNKNGRFYCKTCHFCVIARPPCGRGNL